jgi:hypothetical protein
MDGNSAFATAVLHEYLTRLAHEVAATEAVAFAVTRRNRLTPGDGLDLEAHVRPGDFTPAEREAAVEAFRDIVRPCVEQNKDGAILVSDDPQLYCLVRMLREADVVRGAAAWIVPARDQATARHLLSRLTARAAT